MDHPLKLWVAALESGDYSQIRSQLTRDDGYCCLGVACDIAPIGRWHGPFYEIAGEQSSGSLPTPVRKWLGISVAEQDCYIELNDEHKASFAAIAAAIRKNNPEVFA